MPVIPPSVRVACLSGGSPQGRRALSGPQAAGPPFLLPGVVDLFSFKLLVAGLPPTALQLCVLPLTEQATHLLSSPCRMVRGSGTGISSTLGAHTHTYSTCALYSTLLALLNVFFSTLPSVYHIVSSIFSCIDGYQCYFETLTPKATSYLFQVDLL